MKMPKYFVDDIQQAIDIRLNGFALRLIAESFADDPAKFGDDNVVCLAYTHNNQPVWIILTKTMPTIQDFQLTGTDNNPSPDSEKEGKG